VAHADRRLGVLYIIDDAAKLISVTRVAHRRDVYERL
jgi:mRNA-degrading endonuclease RelE of RelBE toxin-antitoxin system